MRRFEIQIRSRHGHERRIALGRFASLLATVIPVVLTIVVVAFALALGYILLGVALAVVLIGLVIAMLRAAWSSIER